jgi:CubicO group peptidase (beta-lactamase class C family)
MMQSALLLLLLLLQLLLLLPAGSAAPPSSSAPDWRPVTAVLQQAIAQRVFPCASAAVVSSSGSLLFSTALGSLVYADSPAPPASGGANPAASFTSTLYDMASLSKIIGPVTVAAMLVDAQLLSLDALLTEPELLGPAFAAQGKGSITVRHLLLHSAGFPPDPVPNYSELAFGCPNTVANASSGTPALDFSCLQQIEEAVLAQPLQNAVGAVFLYSDLSMITLLLALGRWLLAERPGWAPAAAMGPACAAACGSGASSSSCPAAALATCSFEAFWRANVSAPLGFASESGFLLQQGAAAAAAPTWLDQGPDSYRREQLQGQVSDENSYAAGGIAGHAGLFLSASDVASFVGALGWARGVGAGALAGAGAGRRGLGLSSATIELFTALANSPAGSPRALGWSTMHDSYAGCAPMALDTAYHTGYTGTQICLGSSYSTVLLASRVFPNKTGNVDAIHAVRQSFNAAVAQVLQGLRP